MNPGMHLVQVVCFFRPTVYSSSLQASARTPEEVLMYLYPGLLKQSFTDLAPVFRVTVLGGQVLAVVVVALWPRGQNWFILQGAQPPLATGYMPAGHCKLRRQQHTELYEKL